MNDGTYHANVSFDSAHHSRPRAEGCVGGGGIEENLIGIGRCSGLFLFVWLDSSFFQYLHGGCVDKGERRRIEVLLSVTIVVIENAKNNVLLSN